MGHLVASVLVQHDEKQRHNDDGRQKDESVAERLKETIANPAGLSVMLKRCVNTAAKKKNKYFFQFYVTHNKRALPAKSSEHKHREICITIKKRSNNLLMDHQTCHATFQTAAEDVPGSEVEPQHSVNTTLKILFLPYLLIFYFRCDKWCTK